MVGLVEHNPHLPRDFVIPNPEAMQLFPLYFIGDSPVGNDRET